MDIREIRFRILLKYYFERYKKIPNIPKIKWLLDDYQEEVSDSEIILCNDRLLDGDIDSGDDGTQCYTNKSGISNSGIRKIERFMDDYSDKALYRQDKFKEINDKFVILINLMSNDKPISDSNSIVFNIITNSF